MKRPRLLFALFTFLVGIGCSSQPTYRMGSEPETPADPRVNSAAYGADGFTFNKKMRVRPANNFIFFFKHCDLTGDSSISSMNSYACTYP